MFDEIVRIVERLKKVKWANFKDRRGDPGRDIVLWAGRRFGGMTLKEVGEKVDGMDYSAVAVSVARLAARSINDRELRALMNRVSSQCQMSRCVPT